MKRVLCGLLTLGAVVAVTAATHSAWSERIAWDVVTAVGRRQPAVQAAQAAAMRVACLPGGSVRFEVPAPGAGVLTLWLFDCRGSVVRSLGRAGAGPVEWDRKDGAGREVSPGVYMVRATGPGFSLSTSFTLPR